MDNFTRQVKAYTVHNLSSNETVSCIARHSISAVVLAYGHSIGDYNDIECLMSRYGHMVVVGDKTVAIGDYCTMRD